MQRIRDADLVNDLVNHPDILPHVVPFGVTTLDVRHLVADPHNIVLNGTDGCFIFCYLGEKEYEAHAQYMMDSRGRIALQEAKDALAWMFENTDAQKVTTMIPADNKAAQGMARHVGMRFTHELPDIWPTAYGHVGLRYYAISKAEWERKRV